MTTPKQDALERAAELYANCRNGKQVGVNFTEWQRSYEGHIEGQRHAQSQQFPPAPEEWSKAFYTWYVPNGHAEMEDEQRTAWDAALDLIARPLLKRCEELEAQFAEANRCPFLFLKIDELQREYEADQAAMRDALEALKFYANVKAWFDNTVDNDAGNIARSALARIEEMKSC